MGDLILVLQEEFIVAYFLVYEIILKVAFSEPNLDLVFDWIQLLEGIIFAEIKSLDSASYTLCVFKFLWDFKSTITSREQLILIHKNNSNSFMFSKFSRTLSILESLVTSPFSTKYISNFYHFPPAHWFTTWFSGDSTSHFMWVTEIIKQDLSELLPLLCQWSHWQ